MSVVRWLKQLLRKHGIEVRRLRAVPADALQGLPAETVIDVGVAHGTAWLYESFPDAFLLLIDPLEECRPYVRQLLEMRRGHWEKVGAGATSTYGLLKVEAHIDRSSLLDRTSLSAAGPVTARPIRIATLDSIVGRLGVESPFVLKVDTEGYEDHVIQGARAVLRDCSAVISEVSVQKRFEESYTFEEFLELMNQHGFTVANVLSARADVNGRVRCVDLLHLPDGRLR